MTQPLTAAQVAAWVADPDSRFTIVEGESLRAMASVWRRRREMHRELTHDGRMEELAGLILAFLERHADASVRLYVIPKNDEPIHDDNMPTVFLYDPGTQEFVETM